jgi:hypothetical protein
MVQYGNLGGRAPKLAYNAYYELGTVLNALGK